MKTCRNRSSQGGAGTLAVSLLLMLGMSIAMFYLNRGLIFEQKTSAAQMQSVKAREIAEAGVQWAVGMLNANDNLGTGTNCAADGTGNVNSTSTTFRARYVQTQMDTTDPNLDPYAVVPEQAIFPGCRITDAGLGTCGCPTSAGAASLGADVQANFTVAFSPVTIMGTATVDTESVLITATGCTDTASVCTPANATAAAGPDATATVSVVVKLSPELRAMPASPLTCGLRCQVGGSYNIINRDVATNGILVNAGTTIELSNGAVNGATTLPGLPYQNALVGSDTSLSNLASNDTDCSDSAIFESYFGTSVQTYRDSAKELSCTSTSNCVSVLTAAYNQGYSSFYFTSDVQLSGNGTLGSRNRPITIVTPNSLRINGDWTIYGLVFSNSADVNDNGTGSAQINGAMLTCANYNNNGNGTLTYDPDVLRNLRYGHSARLLPVPGSWRDFTPGAN